MNFDKEHELKWRIFPVEKAKYYPYYPPLAFVRFSFLVVFKLKINF